MHIENGNIKEYSYSNNTGDAQAIVYHLFPGVEVAYITVHMADFNFGLFEQGERKNYVTIHYCRDGRIEQEVHQEFFYLMPGDCSIAIQNTAEKMFQLPLKHYHGISIGHANVWYTSTGGVQALDTMLLDLEAALLN